MFISFFPLIANGLQFRAIEERRDGDGIAKQLPQSSTGRFEVNVDARSSGA
jgi:hypothetical protein